MKIILVLLSCIAVAVQAFAPESRYIYSNVRNNLYHGIRSVPYTPYVPALRNIHNTYDVANVEGYRALPVASNYWGRDSGQYYHG